MIVHGKFLLDKKLREVFPSRLDLGKISLYVILLSVNSRLWSKGRLFSYPSGKLGSMFKNLSPIRIFIMIVTFMERDPSGGI